MAKLVILTLEYGEAREMMKVLNTHVTPTAPMQQAQLREGMRKLQQQLINVNPLEKHA